MLGTFSENSLLSYGQQAAQAFKEKRIAGKQGMEHADNEGIGENDHSFIDSEGSQDLDDYCEQYDYTACLKRSENICYSRDERECRGL